MSTIEKPYTASKCASALSKIARAVGEEEITVDCAEEDGFHDCLPAREGRLNVLRTLNLEFLLLVPDNSAERLDDCG